MSVNEKIDACYVTQAQNLFKKSNADSSGIKIEQAGSLFNAINLDTAYRDSKDTYLRGVDANNDGSISVEELASVLQRADKQKATVAYDTRTRNNQVTNSVELNCDFAKNGALPFLLSEAKTKDPEKYEQIKKRLETGAFTVTGTNRSQDINLLQKQTDGSNYAGVMNETARRYEFLKDVPNSNVSKIFLDKLAQGQVPKYEITPDGKITFKEHNYKDNSVSETEETYNLRNAEKPISAKTAPAESLTYKQPKKISLDKDPLGNAASEKINKEVLTDEQLKYYDDHILEAVDDPQKFCELTEKLSADMKKAYNVNTSHITITEDVGSLAGGYNQKIDKVIIPYSTYTSMKDGLEKAGVPKEKMQQELAKALVGTIAHEYWHAKQIDLTKNPPSNASPEELANIAAFKDNSENYLSGFYNFKMSGSGKDYTEQPLEKSAYELEASVDKHIDDWYAKRNISTPK